MLDGSSAWRWGKWTAAVFVVLLLVPPYSGDPYIVLGQQLGAAVMVGAVGLVLTGACRGPGRVSPG